MIVSPRPTDLSKFTTVEANFYTSGFSALLEPYDFSYLKREILDWLDEISGEAYWELQAQDEFFVGVILNHYVHDFRFIFYFRQPSDAVLFKLQWIDAE